MDAGESIFSIVTGKQGDTQKKITDGAARLLDGALPVLASRVTFNLDSVIKSATGILSDIAPRADGTEKEERTV